MGHLIMTTVPWPFWPELHYYTPKFIANFHKTMVENSHISVYTDLWEKKYIFFFMSMINFIIPVSITLDTTKIRPATNNKRKSSASVGIVFGVVASILVVGAIGFLLFKKWKSGKNSQQPAGHNNQNFQIEWLYSSHYVYWFFLMYSYLSN